MTPPGAAGGGVGRPLAVLGGAGLVAVLAAAMLPGDGATVAVVAAIVLFGVPHGALDAEIGRALLRPRFGKTWFPVFALPYLGLAALVLLGWRLAPVPALVLFLAASVFHFGTEDAGPSSPLEAAARGGLVVAAPVLFRPEQTARFLGAVARVPIGTIPPVLHAGSLVWAALFAAWAIAAARGGRRAALGEAAALLVVFALARPVVAFAAYFVTLHAPRHVAALIRSGRAPRVRDLRSALRLAAPVTLLTVAIGAALSPLFAGGSDADGLLALTIQGLSALTLPHLLLNDALPFVATRSVPVKRGPPFRRWKEVRNGGSHA